ncbi:hypothetical protein Tco_0437997, partial [Tanacetum coccineum]
TDISKITRKPSKTGKHGHEKRKSTKEARDAKPKPGKIKKSKLWSTLGQFSVNRSQPQNDKTPILWKGIQLRKESHGLYWLILNKPELLISSFELFYLCLAKVTGADDEEVSEGGIPRVIILGYDGLLIQPVAPSSPDYIPGLEDPQTPPVPQDEDEREPMFIQAQDPDYVPEPIYPEYIPLEDEHEFLVEEQPILLVDSPTAESPGHVTESDPEEDPEEYEDDETEDGLVDYPMDGGDDGDDDDSDSSRDDANDEDEDEEEKKEHLAPADSAIVVPVDEPVFPHEGTEPDIPPPSTDITIGARVTIRP